MKVGEVPSLVRRRQHEEEQLREAGECYRDPHRPPAARDGPFYDVKSELEEQKPQGLVLSFYFEGDNCHYSGFQNKSVINLNSLKMKKIKI